MLLFTFTVVTGPPSSKWYQENYLSEPEIFVIAVVKLSRAQIGDFYLDPLRHTELFRAFKTELHLFF